MYFVVSFLSRKLPPCWLETGNFYLLLVLRVFHSKLVQMIMKKLQREFLSRKRNWEHWSWHLRKIKCWVNFNYLHYWNLLMRKVVQKDEKMEAYLFKTCLYMQSSHKLLNRFCQILNILKYCGQLLSINNIWNCMCY